MPTSASLASLADGSHSWGVVAIAVAAAAAADGEAAARLLRRVVVVMATAAAVLSWPAGSLDPVVRPVPSGGGDDERRRHPPQQPGCCLCLCPRPPTMDDDDNNEVATAAVSADPTGEEEDETITWVAVVSARMAGTAATDASFMVVALGVVFHRDRAEMGSGIRYEMRWVDGRAMKVDGRVMYISTQ